MGVYTWLWHTTERKRTCDYDIPVNRLHVLFVGFNQTGIWLYSTLIPFGYLLDQRGRLSSYDGPWVTWRGKVSVAVPQCLAWTSPVRHYCLTWMHYTTDGPAHSSRRRVSSYLALYRQRSVAGCGSPGPSRHATERGRPHQIPGCPISAPCRLCECRWRLHPTNDSETVTSMNLRPGSVVIY